MIIEDIETFLINVKKKALTFPKRLPLFRYFLEAFSTVNCEKKWDVVYIDFRHWNNNVSWMIFYRIAWKRSNLKAYSIVHLGKGSPVPAKSLGEENFEFKPFSPR